MQIQTKIFLTLISILTVGAMFTSLVSAQTTPGDGTGVNQDTTQPIPQNDNTIGGTANQDDGTNWWWLLPIIAIPVIYMLYRAMKDNDRDTYRERDMMGARGGRAERDEKDEDIF